MTKEELPLTVALNADLHCHSVYSDGMLTPQELALRAKNNGVELWALTDHDEVAGVEEAARAAQQLNLPFLTGVEISINFAEESVHIVGLGVDVRNQALLNGLQQIRQGRCTRGEKIAQALEKLGIQNAYEGALEHASSADTLSRTHFSRFLVAAGVCQDNQEVFNKYLAKGKPAYIKHPWVSLQECLMWIHDAGGIAVIAHPGRYRGLSKNQHHALFTEFCRLGGQAVEVVTGSHSPEEAIKYAGLAKELGLWASRGSDFHAPNESRIDLGTLPRLPTMLSPVWAALSNRIIYPTLRSESS